MPSIRSLVFVLAALLSAPLVAVAQSGEAVLRGVGEGGFSWRHIGPASFGGRIDDVDVAPGDTSTIFVATASGGLFKTVNHGVTWKAVFDEAGGSLSIGDVTIAPSDRNIVWVGTGEPNNRQSSSWGDGVYKSVDGGETWRHMGLAETHHIGRIAIDPRNPDVVYVAALGRLWGANEQRGLFKTTDGGQTWEKVLYVDPDTGVVDVALGADGRTLFAAAYQRRRRAWGFVGGGPGSGLYRSQDAGATWEKLAGGLPSGNVGRIGVEISRSHPHIVYATYQHKDGGVFRSEDRGRTWARVNELNPRPMYYSKIRIDPRNPQKVWVLGTLLHLSEDGGRTFRTEGTGELIHVDHHALWINPDNPEHMVLGNDGGLYFSYDGSRHWHFVDNLPIGQYYDIGVDTREPYWIYGGTQDNGTWGIPSRTASALGITNADVVNIAYGDGFYTEVDPADHRVIYANSQNGRAYLVDLDTREERGIRPVPGDPKERYRFNWSTPLLVSPHDSKVVYYGGNKLFRTSNQGQTWEEASPDLTRNLDWKTLPIMGAERNADTLSRDDGVADYGTITTIAESPLQAGVLYVGTDDGNVQVSRDGGATWQDVTSRFKLPGPRWVSRVIASRHDTGTAYVSFDGHQDDDFAPYVFKTTDFGATWANVSGDLPTGMVVNALAEHWRSPRLLFAGTEFGLFVSTTGGTRWTRAPGSLPRVPIDDIVVEERYNDLVLGTHGRSIIVLDDVTPLEHLEEAARGDAHLFPIAAATQYYEQRLLPVPGAAKFSGPNPAAGALITYFLKDPPPARDDSDAKPPTVTLRIRDASGTTIRELHGEDRQGTTRIAWDLRYPLPERADTSEGWFGPTKGPWVMPGDYTVTLVARGREMSQTVTVKADPAARTSRAVLTARHAAATAANELLRAFDDAARAMQAVDRDVKAFEALMKDGKDVPSEVQEALAAVKKTHEGLKERFTPGGFGGPRFQITDLKGQLQASSREPTDAQLRTIDRLTADITEGIALLNGFTSGELPALQRMARERGVAPAGVEPVRPPARAGSLAEPPR
ncbi:MAG: glycosyl hydrolase [Acidobacteria bacterium]|nr:glycosyl hydrolase [Acidobacteriota bacterium]